LFTTQGDLTSEDSVAKAFEAAVDHFGPLNILVANAGITDESSHPPIWEIDQGLWDKVGGRLCEWWLKLLTHQIR
jgi:NAD(P)-dependent dehydrogenase (short-subunit alcohol dehydrogenase family)